MNGPDTQAAAKQHVLVIEDNAAIGRLVTLILSGSGFRVTSCQDGESGIEAARKDAPDAILLDLTLPGMSGQDTLTALEKSTLAPVIVLTAADSTDVFIECLEQGAFDIALKPFEPDDLDACVQLAVGVATSLKSSTPTLKAPDFELDFASHRFTRNGQPGQLSLSEWRLLEVLASRPGQTVLYQELLGRVWGPQFRNRLDLLHAWTERLQKKVGLTEFHGVGYALNV